MDGYKIRAVGAIHSDWLNTLGAAAQTMSAIDMNQALDRDIVDGGIQGWSGMRTFGSFPLVEQAWDIPVGMTPFLLLINEESWQRQPASVQRACCTTADSALPVAAVRPMPPSTSRFAPRSGKLTNRS
ncbi:MAG: hypothetical protein CM15mP84_00630 [Cellvibrionales bacterium]|nr:MAG: hypothetical protein CM15mP84_00630 [Cellvibrionales bacterium]